MRCERCGVELSSDGYCPSCDAESHVQILTPAERNAYRGVTIEDGHPENETRSDIRFNRRKPGWSVFFNPPGSWQGKLTLLLGAAAVLFFVFFVALPVAIAAVVFSVVSWFLYRLFL